MNEVVEIKGLTKSYGNVTAIHELSFLWRKTRYTGFSAETVQEKPQ